ncbi:MAG: MBL fold metallo-hydrolase [Chloroflexi bacterium]|nr:MBL fold metallo-hydrolase [Chloroflexota bacterium]
MARRNVPRKWPAGMIEVAPGVFGYIQAGGVTGVSNGGLIVGDEGAIAVDALFVPSMTRRYLRAIRRTTHRPVTHLINTHHHIDHVGGNQFFAKSEIVAHVNAREEVIRFGLPLDLLRRFIPEFAGEMEQIKITPPTLTYAGQMTLHQGGRVIELLYMGPAHTPGDTLIYLPQEKVLFAGDVAFHYVVPGPFDCHVSGWIRVCDRAAELDVDVIVPGHGPIGAKSDMREMRDYLALVRREARRSFAAGEPEEEAARKLKVGGFYAQWANPERLPLLVQRLYMEFRGEM